MKQYDEWRLALVETMLRDTVYLLVCARSWLGSENFSRAAYGSAWTSAMAVVTLECALSTLRTQGLDEVP